MQRKSFIKGAAVLGGAGLIVKMIGLLYRIPLANIIGPAGIGLYQSAYPYYALLLMISTAGLPPVISKLVSQHMARGDRAGANKIFRVSLGLLSITGMIFALVLFFFSDKFALMAKDSLVQLAISYIAPALFFVAILSAIRGYFQGLQNMFPTAMTQIVEQIGKVILGLTFAYLMIPKGIEYGAAGAVLGVMLSELIAVIVIIIYYLTKREKAPRSAVAYQSVKRIIKDIMKLAVPILIGASIMPIVALADLFIIKSRLIAIGYLQEDVRVMFAIFTGYVNILVNVPGTVSLGFCVSLVPAISAAKSTGDYDNLKKNAKIGFKMAMLVGIPSAIGLFVLSTPIMDLLYGYKLTASQVTLAGNLLAIIAGGVIFLSVLQTLNGVLQGIGKVMVPVAALATGAVVKIILGYWLIGILQINIYGAPISTFACYLVAAIIDIIMVKKLTGVKFGFVECVLRPTIASLFMGAAAWGSYALLFNHINTSIATVIAVIIGVIIFIVCIPIFSVLRRSEILGLPGGSKMIKIYDKLSREIN